MAPRIPKTYPRYPKFHPRCPQDLPKTIPRALKMFPNCPKSLPIALETLRKLILVVLGRLGGVFHVPRTACGQCESKFNSKFESKVPSSTCRPHYVNQFSSTILGKFRKGFAEDILFWVQISLGKCETECTDNLQTSAKLMQKTLQNSLC